MACSASQSQHLASNPLILITADAQGQMARQVGDDVEDKVSTELLGGPKGRAFMRPGGYEDPAEEEARQQVSAPQVSAGALAAVRTPAPAPRAFRHVNPVFANEEGGFWG